MYIYIYLQNKGELDPVCHCQGQFWSAPRDACAYVHNNILNIICMKCTKYHVYMDIFYDAVAQTMKINGLYIYILRR